MAAINLNTGDRLWSRDIGGIQTPWAAGDYVYVLTTDEQLICLTRKEGKVRWIHQLPHCEDPKTTRATPIVWAGPVLVSDRLIAGLVQRLSPRRSRPIPASCWAGWRFPAGTSIAPVVANGTLYLYTNDAELVALR